MVLCVYAPLCTAVVSCCIYLLHVRRIAKCCCMTIFLEHLGTTKHTWLHRQRYNMWCLLRLFDNLGISQKDKKNWFAVNWGIRKLRQNYWGNHHESWDFGNIPKPNHPCIPYLATHWLSVNICPLWLGVYTAGTYLFCGSCQYFVLESWPRGVNKPELYSCSVKSFQRKLSSMNDGTAFIARLNKRECSYHQCEQTKLTMTITLKIQRTWIVWVMFLQTLYIYTFIVMDSYYH